MDFDFGSVVNMDVDNGTEFAAGDDADCWKDFDDVVASLPPLDLSEFSFETSLQNVAGSVLNGQRASNPSLPGTLQNQVNQLQLERFQRAKEDEEDDGTDSAGEKVTPPKAIFVYVVGNDEFINTRHLFVVWNSKSRSAKKAFHSFVRTFQDAEENLLEFTREDDPLNIWEKVTYRNAQSVMLVKRPFLARVVERFNQVMNYSFPPVDWSSDPNVEKVLINCNNMPSKSTGSKQGGDKKAQKRGRRTVKDEVKPLAPPPEDFPLRLDAVVPQAGPAHVPMRITLCGDSFSQCCFSAVLYKTNLSDVGPAATGTLPVLTLENKLLTCLLPPLPACVVSLRVALSALEPVTQANGSISQSARLSDVVQYVVVDMPENVRAFFMGQGPGSGGGANGGGGNFNNGSFNGPNAASGGGNNNNNSSSNNGGVHYNAPGGFNKLHMVAAYGELADIEKVVLQLRRGVSRSDVAKDRESRLDLYRKLINEPDDGGRTALHWVLLRGDGRSERWTRTAVHFLLLAGLDPNRVTKDGVSALHLLSAKEMEKPTSLSLLLNWKSKVLGALSVLDAPDVLGRTPLYYAVDMNNSVAVKALVEAGADPFVRDFRGVAPFQRAKDPSIQAYFRDFVSGLSRVAWSTHELFEKMRRDDVAAMERLAANERLATNELCAPKIPVADGVGGGRKTPSPTASPKPSPRPKRPVEDAPSSPPSLKMVVVGDGGCGKTCFLIRASGSSFPTEYIPTVFDNYEVDRSVQGRRYRISLWDTAGQEGYSRIRTLSYPGSDIFIVCYSVARRSSFDNVTSKWIPEVTHHSPNAMVVLAAMKTDLRNEFPDCVTTEEGRALAKTIRARKYFEISSLTGEGVDIAIDESVAAFSEPIPRTEAAKKKGGCTML